MKNKKRILILGDGLLGSELHKQTGWDYISRKKDGFDANNFNSYYMNNILGNKRYTDIINCIAHTNTRDENRELHWQINTVFVSNLIDYCNNYAEKLIHISTDYLYAKSKPFAKETDALCPPANWYGYSKLVGDSIVQLYSNNYLVIRETHKPKPYPYVYAWADLIGNFDYVDVIAKIIIDLVNGDANGVYNVGTEVKSLYELARRTNPDVKVDTSENSTDRPTNTTMDLTKLENFYETRRYNK